jgi:hypothetical protein
MHRDIDDRVLRALPSALKKSKTPDDAVRRVSLEVKRALPSLWRTTLNKLSNDASLVECVAVWCDRKTDLKPGIRVSALVTAIPEALKRGGPVVSSEHPSSASSLKAVLSEGTQSWTVIPLYNGRSSVGALTLSSREQNAIEEKSLGFFADLGRSIQERLAWFL